MRLSDWCEKHNIKATEPTSERSAVSVVVEQTHPGRPDLFHLEDYTVSSSAGCVVWLIPGPSYTARKKHIDRFDVQYVSAVNALAKKFVGKTIFCHTVKARYKIVRVGVDRVQAVNERTGEIRLWQDPITLSELEELERCRDVAIVESREDLLERSLRELVEICQWKCSPHDEVVLESGRSNRSALRDAVKLVGGAS